MRYLNRQLRGSQALVEFARTALPQRIQVAIQRAQRLALQAPEEHVHGAHDIGVRVEGAARQAYIGRALLAVALHQLAAAADRADRQSAAERLAVGDHVGAHAEVLLRATRRETEADEHLVEDEHDVARSEEHTSE